MATLVLSYCGCVTLYNQAELLQIIDSEKLPISDVNYLGLIIDSDVYLFDNIFASKADVLTYLNDTLKPSVPLTGSFSIVGNFIDYLNNENFNTIEIMAIYETKTVVVQIGSPAPSDINVTLLETVANTSSYQNNDLIGWDLVFARFGNSNQEPITSTGYDYDSTTGTFANAQQMEDIFLYLTIKQTPP